MLIDNVSGSLGSPTLDRALTAETWRDRLLGGNEQVSVPLEVTWLATGNNLRLTGDTPRRRGAGSSPARPGSRARATPGFCPPERMNSTSPA